MKRLTEVAVFCVVMICMWIGGAQMATAHEDAPPPSSDPKGDEVKHMCLVIGARAAWGAEANYMGAPLTFKYVDHDEASKIFRMQPEQMPADAIYLWDAFGEDFTMKREFEETVQIGWKAAEKWRHMEQAAPFPGYEVLMGIFYQSCLAQATKAPQ
jgi:hypothetical protein